MSRLDDELNIALRREDPPAGFAERVLAGAPATRWTRPRWAAAIAAALLLAAGVEFERNGVCVRKGSRPSSGLCLRSTLPAAN